MRPVNDATLRKIIFASGKPMASQTVIENNNLENSIDQQQQLLQQPQAPFPAGRELLLECITPDLGQPKANVWLWFRNNQPISGPTNPGADDGDSMVMAMIPSGDNNNPISGRELSATSSLRLRMGDRGRQRRWNEASGPSQADQLQEESANQPQPQSEIRLLAAGRYLFIPTIQLAHKGNYSCVAVNRLGSSLQQPQQQQSGNQHSTGPSNFNSERDSYQVRVALAPSFVKPLPVKTYWLESAETRQLELVCHVQCEPICKIEWLKNNEPLDISRQLELAGFSSIQYQIKQSIMDESPAANLFKSVESRLLIKFGGENQYANLKIRQLLSNVNYTCQSSPNSMGPPVRSTTRLTVQCK